MRGEKIVKARRIAWVSWTFLTLFFIGIPSFVHADIDDILSKFYPYITVQEIYSNNIFLSKTNTLNDFITTVSPGLRFIDLKPGAYGIDLDFVAGYTYYAKHHDFSYFSPQGRLDAWYAMTPNLTFRVRDYVIRSLQQESSYILPMPQQINFFFLPREGSMRSISETLLSHPCNIVLGEKTSFPSFIETTFIIIRALCLKTVKKIRSTPDSTTGSILETA